MLRSLACAVLLFASGGALADPPADSPPATAGPGVDVVGEPRADTPLAVARPGKRLVTTGWVLVAAGPPVAFGGYVLALASFISNDSGPAAAGSVVVVAGAGAFVTGLVLLPMGYGKNAKARKEATVSVVPMPRGLAIHATF